MVDGGFPSLVVFNHIFRRVVKFPSRRAWGEWTSFRSRCNVASTNGRAEQSKKEVACCGLGDPQGWRDLKLLLAVASPSLRLPLRACLSVVLEKGRERLSFAHTHTHTHNSLAHTHIHTLMPEA